MRKKWAKSVPLDFDEVRTPLIIPYPLNGGFVNKVWHQLKQWKFLNREIKKIHNFQKDFQEYRWEELYINIFQF